MAFFGVRSLQTDLCQIAVPVDSRNAAFPDRNSSAYETIAAVLQKGFTVISYTASPCGRFTFAQPAQFLSPYQCLDRAASASWPRLVQ